ncbi:hypothetical protein BpHYR1_011812 [Brachionus plicatilis]|uniref:DUF6314 domain-containing protein n=1 Tax=Brachionus plicatilis TaxID=10195 RepID=A0A3M7RWL9_BRAPC|nr:hypothetical protein BpHYR1_011812 [Brachionus plicatilis]
MNLTQKIFSFFKGSWSASRTIVNTGAFNGTASFESSETNANELIYNEKGVFEFFDRADSKFDASRSFLYSLVDDKDIQVFFNDKGSEKKLFHCFRCESIGDHTENRIKFKNRHFCSPDTYDITYEIDFENDQFEITYDVSGPEKSYISKTLFKKIS